MLNVSPRSKWGIGALVMAVVLAAPALFAYKAPPVQVVTDDSGQVSVFNLTAKAIFGMCGTFEYEDLDTGQLRTVRWTRSFVGVFFDRSRALAARHGEYRFSPVRYRGYPDRFIRRENLVVLGGVFEDGTTWGDEGEYIKTQIFARASEALLQLMEIRQVLRQHEGWQDRERLLTGLRPMVRGRDAELVHLKLRKHLSTSEVPRRLRSDYMDRLELLIERLGQLSSTKRASNLEPQE